MHRLKNSNRKNFENFHFRAKKILFPLFYTHKSRLHRPKKFISSEKNFENMHFRKICFIRKITRVIRQNMILPLFYTHKSGLHRLKNSFRVRKNFDYFLLRKICFIRKIKWVIREKKCFSRCLIHMKVVCVACKIYFEWEKFRKISFSYNLFYTENDMSYTQEKAFSVVLYI